MGRRSRGVGAFLGLSLLCVSLFAMSGCTASTGSATSTAEAVTEEPRSGGTLRVAILEPRGIDPLRIQDTAGAGVALALFEPLVSFDPLTGQISPLAAESWESDKDETIWTFHLRQGMKFHNGREVVAQDFKYQWDRLCDPDNESPAAYFLSAVKGFDEMQSGQAEELTGVEVPDDYTVRVTLGYPFADFVYGLTTPVLAPVPREEVEKDPKAYSEMPVGNGPFRMAEPWCHDQYIKVIRFEDYAGQAALLDGVEFRALKDEGTAFLEFKAGILDFTLIPTGTVRAAVAEYGKSIDGLEASPGHQVLLGPELAIAFLVVNGRDELLKNVDLRRALSLGINRQAIAETVYEGTRVASTSVIPEGIVGYEVNAWPYCRYDVDAAEALLAKAGYPEGRGLPRLSLSYNTGVGHEQVFQMVQADLAAIGVESELDGMEWGTYLEKLQTQAFQIGRLGWAVDSPIIDGLIYPLFASDSPDNLSAYASPTVDRSIMEARQIADDRKRIEAYQAIVREIGESAPVIPLVDYRHRFVVSDRVRHLICSPQGTLNLQSCWLTAD